MSKTKRKKMERKIKTRRIVTAACLIAALVVFLLGIRDWVFNGLSGTSIQYGFAVLLLFFGSGYFGAPLLLAEMERRKQSGRSNERRDERAVH